MPDKIPSRMHFPYALRVARRGFAIRRLSWTDVWWVWRFGVMIRIEDGEPDRVVTSTDYEAEDLLSWDWTTLPAGCESLDQAPDMAELLTVRPYDGLPVSADPLGRKCDLPSKAEAVEFGDWPTLAPPKVAGRRVQWARPPFPPAPGLPKSDWPVSQWSPRKRPPLPPGVEPPPPPPPPGVTVSLFTRKFLSGLFGDHLSGTDWSAQHSQSSYVTGTGDMLESIYGELRITGGTPGAFFSIVIGIANSLTTPTSFVATWWDGLRQANPAPNDPYGWTGAPSLIYEVGDPPIAVALRWQQGGNTGWHVAPIHLPTYSAS